jgi:hypothetical protein
MAKKAHSPLALSVAGALLTTGPGVVTEAIQHARRAPVEETAPATAVAQPQAAACNYTSLAACPINGCAAPGSAAAALNQRKRTIPEGASPTLLTFDDFKQLQAEAASIFPPKKELQIPPAGRAKLTQLNFSHGTVGEADLVQVTGYIVADPHPNPGESVNCDLTPAADSDFHIPLGANATDTDFSGIVVEMIPQDRSSAWTIPKLLDIQSKQLQVRVTGQLLYDNVHVPNDNPNDVIGGQPHRMSLWEVHPITEFLVCSDEAGNKPAQDCDVNKGATWLPIDRYPTPTRAQAKSS